MAKDKPSPIVHPIKPWEEIIKAYLTRQRVRRNSKLTIVKYEFVLAEYFKFSNGKASKTLIREYLNSLSGENFKAITINKYQTTLNTFFKWATKLEYIKSNPAETVPFRKKESRLSVFIRDEQMKKLYKDIEKRNDVSVQDAIMFDVFYSTGIRTDELCHLKFEDLYLKRGKLKITKGKGDKERIIIIPNRAIEGIKKYIPMVKRNFPANEYLFPNKRGKRINAKSVYVSMSRILSTLLEEKKGAHTLRHSFATVLIEKGAPMEAVKDQLGHASISTTEAYTHNVIEKLKRVHESAHPRG